MILGIVSVWVAYLALIQGSLPHTLENAAMNLQAKHWAGHDQLNDILGASSAVSLTQNTCS